MIRQSTYYALLFVLLSGIFLISSCKEYIIDPIEEESGIYSFYGTLNVEEPINYVRIKDLNKEFLSGLTEFEGSVTFEDIETGEITTLQDSIVNFGGNFTHNFIIEEQLKYNNRYLLKAISQDGEVVESVASTPGKAELFFTPDEFIYCERTVHFRFHNVVNPEFIQLSISVKHNNQQKSADLSVFIQELKQIVDRDMIEIKMSPRNLLVEVFPEFVPDIPASSPLYDPYKFFPSVPCEEFISEDLHITYTHFGSEWISARPFGGLIDTESGDVKNGLGFLGAYYQETFTINIAETPEAE